MNLAERFLTEVGRDRIFYIESDYLPLLITVDWFKGIDRDGVMHRCYPFLLYKSGMNVKGYWNATKYRALSQELFDRYVVGKLDIDSFTKDYEERCGRIEELYESYFKRRGTLSEDELLAFLRNANDAFLNLTDITLAFDALDQSIIGKVLQERRVNADLAKVWEASEMTAFASFELRNDEEIAAEKGSLERLQHIFSNYTHIPAVEEIGALVKGKTGVLAEEIAHRRQELAENIGRKEKLSVELGAEERRVLAFVDWSGWLRDDRKTLITKTDVLFFDVIGDLYRAWGLEPELVPVSLVYEVLRGKEAVLAQKQTLQARTTKMVVLYEGDDRYFEEPKTTEADIAALDQAYFRQNASEDEGTVRGEVASRGKTTGVVRIVLEKTQFDAFVEGEILVTGMTRPEFVPLMKKAAGIVTDEGGITSHAAIVSRELKKPCVIGTKIATKVFKDGDRVEVDAEKGIVRKLG